MLSYYLAHQPMEDYQPMQFDFPNEDILFVRDFNFPNDAQGHVIGGIITSPISYHLPFTARFCFDCTNNMVEYEACIFGIEATIDLGIKILEVYGDSTLVISQVRGDWETRDSKLIAYREHVMKFIPYFDKITFHHIPGEENQLADALATLSSIFKVKWKNEAPYIHIEHLNEPSYCLATKEESGGKPWFYDIKTYLEKQVCPGNASIIDKKAMRNLSTKFFLSGDMFFK